MCKTRKTYILVHGLVAPLIIFWAKGNSSLNRLNWFCVNLPHSRSSNLENNLKPIKSNLAQSFNKEKKQIVGVHHVNGKANYQNLSFAPN